MEPLTPAMRDAMAQVRLTSRRLRAMAAAQHDKMVRVLALGLPPGVVPGEARPPGAMRLLRPAGASAPGQQLGGGRRQALRAVAEAAAASSRARADQRRALRDARAAGVPIEVLAAEAGVSEGEVRRVTERVLLP